MSNIRIQNMQQVNQNTARQGTTQTNSKELDGEQSKFEEKLSKRKSQNEKGLKNPFQKSKQEMLENAEQSLFDSSSLFSLRGSADKGMDHASKVNNLSNSSQGALETIERLSERILVSVPRADGSKEVHIQLKNDLLPNTEIRIQLDGKNLQVGLICADMQTSNFLTQHSNSLQQTLAGKHQGEVAVTVDTGANQNQEQQDGRSKQQRNLYEEMENKK